MFHPLYLRCFRGCGLGELAGSRVLCLWEQVRDLRVQKFLREKVVGIAAPSDLARSIIVEIRHCGESGETWSKWLELRNNSLMFVIAYLSLSLTCVLYLTCSY